MCELFSVDSSNITNHTKQLSIQIEFILSSFYWPSTHLVAPSVSEVDPPSVGEVDLTLTMALKEF